MNWALYAVAAVLAGAALTVVAGDGKPARSGVTGGQAAAVVVVIAAMVVVVVLAAIRLS